MAAVGGSVARRYARALFGIGVDAGNFEELGQELDDFARLLGDSAELRQALENPVFKPAARSAPCWRSSCRGSRRRPRCSASCCCCSSAAASCCCRPSRARTGELADAHLGPRARRR